MAGALTAAFLILLAVYLIGQALRPRRRTRHTTSTYTPRRHLCTPTELRFFHTLKTAFPNHSIMTHVRLADVIDPDRHLSHFQQRIAFQRISQKHIDFLICDPTTLIILHAIELDDRSHRHAKRQYADATKTEALASAGIHLHRFEANAHDTPTTILARLT